MAVKNREPPTSIRIYLFTLNGEFLWANHQSEVGENEAILISGLVATINKFASEILRENLHKLILNELNIHLFNILDQFLVAIILPNYINQNLFQSQLLVNEMLKLHSSTLSNDLDERLPAVIAVLTELNQKLESWLKGVSYVSSELALVFSDIITTLDEHNLSFTLYSPTGLRVYKYFSQTSGVNDLNYPLNSDNPLDTMIFSQLKGGVLILQNMILYFNTIEDYIAIFIKKRTNSLENINVDEFEKAYTKISKIIMKSLKP